MKKLLCIALIAISICTCCTPALADSLPAKAAKAIQEAGWEGYKAATVYTRGPLDMVYAVMRNGNQNLFCVLEYDRESKEYRLLAANENFLPPGKITPKFIYYSSVGEFYIEYSINKPTPGQPAKVVMQFLDDGITMQYAELTYPAGGDRLFPQDIILSKGHGSYALTRVKVDRRGEYVESVDSLSIERADWVYHLASFSLEQALSDIAYARGESEGGLRPLLVPVPAELIAAADAGELVQFDDLFVNVNATYVSLSSRGLTDVSALAKLPALETLYLANNQITDLRPLAGLVNLQTLVIRNNQVKDLGPLAGMRQLKKLLADGNPIMDLTPVAMCAALDELDVRGGNVTDLSPLAGLENLQCLRLNACGLASADLWPLAALPELRVLNLDNNQIADLEPLRGMAGLTNLSLSNNQITDLQPLINLKELAELALNGNPVANLSILRELSGLTRLYIDPGMDVRQVKALKQQLNHCEIISVAKPVEEPQTVVSGKWMYSILEDGSAVIMGHTANPRGSLKIPGTVDGRAVTGIGYQAFNADELTSVTIPDGVISIGDMAFANCSTLTSIRIPDTVTHIGNNVFKNSSHIKSLTLPNNLISLGDNALNGTMTSIIIPESVVEMGSNPFANCGKLANIGVAAQNPVYTTVDGVLFNKQQQILIAYPRSLPNDATYEIPQGVLHIGSNAFEYCDSLSGVTIPYSVISIGDKAFSNCAALTGVVIPGSVTGIGDWAFYHCTALADVAILPGVASIGDWAFYTCENLAGVTIPDSVTYIGEQAFARCEALADITIPNSVTYIGNSAFSKCGGLTGVTIRDGITCIGDNTFESCGALESVTLPASITIIGDNAFARCGKLVLIVTKGSYAEQYAKKNKIPYQLAVE